MAKIGVYVPDERMKHIERWRDKINFSRMFMEAFDRAIVSESAITSIKGKEMKALIERLKKETDGTLEHTWKLGAKEARNWAVNHARYSHLRQIGEGELAFNKPESNVMSFLYTYYPAHYFRTPEDEQGDLEMELYSDAETSRRGFNQGFVDVVKQIWEEVKSAV